MTYLNCAASLTQFWKQWLERWGYSRGQESGEVCGLAFNSLYDLGWVTPLLSLCEQRLIAPLFITSWSGKGGEVNPRKKHIRIVRWKVPGKHEILGSVYLPYSFRKQSKAPPGKNLNRTGSSVKGDASLLREGCKHWSAACKATSPSWVPVYVHRKHPPTLKG